MAFYSFIRKWGWALGGALILGLLGLGLVRARADAGGIFSAAEVAANQAASQLVVYNQPITARHVMTGLTPSAVNLTRSAGSAEDAPRGGPHAVLTSEYFNFGTVALSAVVRRDFFIINRGDAPLVIRQAVTTCGCTTAELTASVIPPGKASRITVIFDAGYHPVAGQTVRRGLLLQTNDPNRPELDIWVQAAVGR